MGGEPTLRILAQELRLRRPIRSSTILTAATGLAGRGGVYQDQRHTGQRRLVGNEGAKLEKGPTMQHSPLAFANRSPAADMRQIFQRNSSAGAFRRADKGLAHTVVHVTR